MKNLLPLIFFHLICSVSFAQNNSAYLIPRTLFVGDKATLVLPLPELKTEADDIILTSGHPDFPADTNIDFHRIVLERRVLGSRLLIEFTAFVPGRLELPVIEAGGEQFSGLTVTINSIIDQRKQNFELSGPAASLVMPGTVFMIFIAITVLVLLTTSIIWFVFKGRRYLNSWKLKWKRWKLFASMKKTEKRLYKALLKGADNRFILDMLSEEFRIFLSFFTGINCRTMTAYELETLQAVTLQAVTALPVDFTFLGKFFRRCDELRFSGEIAGTEDILPLLNDLRVFIEELRVGKTSTPESGTAGKEAGI